MRWGVAFHTGRLSWPAATAGPGPGEDPSSTLHPRHIPTISPTQKPEGKAVNSSAFWGIEQGRDTENTFEAQTESYQQNICVFYFKRKRNMGR